MHRIRKTSQNSGSVFRKNSLKKWFISAPPENEKISQNLGPEIGQKLLKIESLMKRCIGYAKLHRTVVRVFARYYNAEEVIHKRISWNGENISKSGPNVRPSIMKNWTFNEKVHRMRKTSQNRCSLFRKILQCWRCDS